MFTATLNTSKSIHGAVIRTLALAGVLCLVGTVPALASTPENSITVSYSDLDLSTSAGARTLYGRIQFAAKRVCGYEGTDVLSQAIWRKCFHGSVGDAVAKVNSPLLTAVATGRSPAMTAMAK